MFRILFARSWKWWTTLNSEMSNSHYTFRVPSTGSTSMAGNTVHSFRLSFPCLIAEVFAMRSKFLKPSGYLQHSKFVRLLPQRKGPVLTNSGHGRRSKDLIIIDELLSTPSYGRASVERPPRTCLHQHCTDTGCSMEDLLWAIGDREEWRESVREIRARSASWWWWS